MTIGWRLAGINDDAMMCKQLVKLARSAIFGPIWPVERVERRTSWQERENVALGGEALFNGRDGPEREDVARAVTDRRERVHTRSTTSSWLQGRTPANQGNSAVARDKRRSLPQAFWTEDDVGVYFQSLQATVRRRGSTVLRCFQSTPDGHG
ncbi:hypothetical protein CONLIGDRAFT_502698 [Coniochaeta ligniaria NRRL 30616]|uniref:Uncharacterized protein n=1 Tax=Coniochaeta ligniaria NRRL 30616 TaxID=1408157 RepID=A0A1J7IEI6_9PEZI|nr:hypothetical protein CONLIGDRAFT_502698 [Coniochaeta ligniaria NRRL 30616]